MGGQSVRSPLNFVLCPTRPGPFPSDEPFSSATHFLTEKRHKSNVEIQFFVQISVKDAPQIGHQSENRPSNFETNNFGHMTFSPTTHR